MVLGAEIADLPDQRDLVLRLRERRRAYQAALSVALETWLPLRDASSEAALITVLARGLAAQAKDGVVPVQLRATANSYCHRLINARPDQPSDQLVHK